MEKRTANFFTYLPIVVGIIIIVYFAFIWQFDENIKGRAIDAVSGIPQFDLNGPIIFKAENNEVNKRQCEKLSTAITTGFSFGFDTAYQIFYNEVIKINQLGDDSLILLTESPLKAGTIISDKYNDIILNRPAYIGYLDKDKNLLPSHSQFLFILFNNYFQIIGIEDLPTVDNILLTLSTIQIDPTIDLGLNLPPNINVALVGDDDITIKNSEVFEFELPEKNIDPVPSDCPPGFILKKGAIEENSQGIAMTVLQSNDPVIDFETTEARYRNALQNGNFNVFGPVTSIDDFISKLIDFQNLPPESTFALNVNTHGQMLFRVKIKNVLTGKERIIDNFMGDPWTSADQSKDYTDCFPDPTFPRIDLSGENCEDLKDHHAAIPDSHFILEKERVGWCFQLQSKCIKFDPDIHLKSIGSCEKFMVSGACFSGSNIFHDVSGLTVYAGSGDDQPGIAIGSGQKGKPIGQFDTAFNDQFEASPPLDPANVKIDPPKPDFDLAFDAAKTNLESLSKFEIFIALIERIIKGEVDFQNPIKGSVPVDPECRNKLQCIPFGIFSPDDSLPEDDCNKLKNYAARFKDILDLVIGIRTIPNGVSKKEVKEHSIEQLTKFKSCFECPEGKIKKFRGCPQGGLDEIIDRMIDLLQQNNPDLQEAIDLTNAVKFCEVFCVDPEIKKDEAPTDCPIQRKFSLFLQSILDDPTDCPDPSKEFSKIIDEALKEGLSFDCENDVVFEEQDNLVKAVDKKCCRELDSNVPGDKFFIELCNKQCSEQDNFFLGPGTSRCFTDSKCEKSCCNKVTDESCNEQCTAAGEITGFTDSTGFKDKSGECFIDGGCFSACSEFGESFEDLPAEAEFGLDPVELIEDKSRCLIDIDPEIVQGAIVVAINPNLANVNIVLNNGVLNINGPNTQAIINAILLIPQLDIKSNAIEITPDGEAIDIQILDEIINKCGVKSIELAKKGLGLIFPCSKVDRDKDGFNDCCDCDDDPSDDDEICNNELRFLAGVLQSSDVKIRGGQSPIDRINFINQLREADSFGEFSDLLDQEVFKDELQLEDVEVFKFIEQKRIEFCKKNPGCARCINPDSSEQLFDNVDNDCNPITSDGIIDEIIDDGPVCGNEVIETGEECDSSTQAFGDVQCTKIATIVSGQDVKNNCDLNNCICRSKPRCGNDILDIGEQCDTNQKDNCAQNSDCVAANEKQGINDNGPCTCRPRCGNGRQDKNEDCDFNNIDANEFCKGKLNANLAICNNQCKCDKLEENICGNGKIEFGEQCEFRVGSDLFRDSDADASCQTFLFPELDPILDLIPKTTCVRPGEVGECKCKAEPTECGNGVIELGEECEFRIDPNDIFRESDADSSCQTVLFPDLNPIDDIIPNTKCKQPGTKEGCTCEVPDNFCGNGKIELGEECDFKFNDVNFCADRLGLADGDGICTLNCECTNKKCGNGIIDTGEDCEPGNRCIMENEQGNVEIPCSSKCKCENTFCKI